MVKYKFKKYTLPPFIISIMIAFYFSQPSQAKSKCEKKKIECKNASGEVSDCCSQSQICKNGKCFYPGELRILEEKQAALKNIQKQKEEESNIKLSQETTETKKSDNTERIKILGKMLLESSDFKVRIQAAFSLSKIDDPRILPYLIKALDDKHPAVRSATATCLGNTGEQSALTALYKILDRDPNPLVNEAVREAILKIETDPAKLGTLKKVPEVICSVPYAKVKYLFIIDGIDNKAGAKITDIEGLFKRHFANNLKGIENAIIVTEKNKVPNEIAIRVEKGKAFGLIISASLRELNGMWEKSGEYSILAKVSIICSKYPDQTLAMTMNATASSTISKSGYRQKIIPKLQEDAIKGAIESLTKSIKDNLSKIAKEEKTINPKK